MRQNNKDKQQGGSKNGGRTAGLWYCGGDVSE